jgi:hypothetical protein
VQRKRLDHAAGRRPASRAWLLSATQATGCHMSPGVPPSGLPGHLSTPWLGRPPGWAEHGKLSPCLQAPSSSWRPPLSACTRPTPSCRSAARRSGMRAGGSRRRPPPRCSLPSR